MLNPDAKPLPGFGRAIRLPWIEGRGWAVWMAAIASDGGATVNSLGNPVHFTGLAWAGRHGEPMPAAIAPQEVAAASGACLAMPLRRWRELGGFPAPFFLYHEDIDLSMRLRLFGERVGLEPRAVVDHDYSFEGGGAKWRRLERNRWAFLIRVYPAPLLALLAPALALTELALIPVAIGGGWAGAKFGSFVDLAGWMPRLLRERRAIQAEKGGRRGGFRALADSRSRLPFHSSDRPQRPRPYGSARLLGPGARLCSGLVESDRLLRRPDQDLVDVDPLGLLEREDHRPGDVVVAAAPSPRGGCRRTACRPSRARSGSP